MMTEQEANLMNEIGNLQDVYEEMIRSGKVTKKSICDLVIPFRDKYNLTDLEALKIARNEMSISEIAELLSNKESEE